MAELNHSVSPTRTYAILDTTGQVHQVTLPESMRANDNRTAAAYFDKYLDPGVHAELCVSIEQAQYMSEFSFDMDAPELLSEEVAEEEYEERFLRTDAMFDEEELLEQASERNQAFIDEEFDEDADEQD